MDLKVLKQLIAYHQSGLDQHRQHMSPSAQYLEEQTIKALEELREYIVKITTPRIQEAQAILAKRKTRVD